jgi:hypothetical protein
MEDDAPKSAVELAMARFKKQDADEGVRDRQLTDAQKHEIAEVRSTYAAKLAQEEILFKTKMQGLMDSETQQDYHDKYRRDIERINHERDKKIEKIRGS